MSDFEFQIKKEEYKNKNRKYRLSAPKEKIIFNKDWV
jgi:hypothetical protein